MISATTSWQSKTGEYLAVEQASTYRRVLVLLSGSATLLNVPVPPILQMARLGPTGDAIAVQQRRLPQTPTSALSPSASANSRPIAVDLAPSAHAGTLRRTNVRLFCGSVLATNLFEDDMSEVERW